MRDEKVLLVIGASSDMGSALIREISGNYCCILAHYNHGFDTVQVLRNELGDKVVPLQADLSNPKAVENMIGQIKDLSMMPDHIVHFASAPAVNKNFPKHAWQEYAEEIEISFHSFVEIAKEFLPIMKKQHYGKVVLMLTSYTGENPPKYQAPYVSVKYMLLGLMKSLAAEYADKGITVNGVSPDMVETKFLSEIPSLVVEQNAQSNPLGRNIAISDVIPAFAYLLSDGADAVTGQNIFITGGKV